MVFKNLDLHGCVDTEIEALGIHENEKSELKWQNNASREVSIAIAGYNKKNHVLILSSSWKISTHETETNDLLYHEFVVLEDPCQSRPTRLICTMTLKHDCINIYIYIYKA